MCPQPVRMEGGLKGLMCPVVRCPLTSDPWDRIWPSPARETSDQCVLMWAVTGHHGDQFLRFMVIFHCAPYQEGENLLGRGLYGNLGIGLYLDLAIKRPKFH